MRDYTISGIAMVIVGVLLIVVGGGTALGGMNKMDAAGEWEESQTQENCVSTVPSSIDVENDSVEEMNEKLNNSSSTPICAETQPQSNPYSGGQSDVVFGGVLIIVGGFSTYFGNKR